jgi:hypothetical protein
LSQAELAEGAGLATATIDQAGADQEVGASKAGLAATIYAILEDPGVIFVEAGMKNLVFACDGLVPMMRGLISVGVVTDLRRLRGFHGP